MSVNAHIISNLGNIGYYEWDVTTNGYADVSEEFAKMHGLTRDEFLLNYRDRVVDITRWLHPDDIDQYNDLDAYYEANPQRLNIDYRVLDREGNTKHVSETAEPVFDKTGAVVRWYGIVQDVTDRVRLEEERAASLVREKEDADSANRAKTKFLTRSKARYFWNLAKN